MITETIGSMDTAVEPTRTYLQRVAEVISLLATAQYSTFKNQNLLCSINLFHHKLAEILRLHSG